MVFGVGFRLCWSAMASASVCCSSLQVCYACAVSDQKKIIVVSAVNVVWYYGIYCWYNADLNKRYTIQWHGIICDDLWVIQSIGLYCPMGFLLCRGCDLVCGVLCTWCELCQVMWADRTNCYIRSEDTTHWENPSEWKMGCGAIWWLDMWYSAKSGILFDCRAYYWVVQNVIPD